MSFLVFFDNLWFQSALLCFIIFYLMVAILFSAQFSCHSVFDRPVLLNSFNFFSIFVLVLLFWLLCFDFVSNDKHYFFSQNIQILFVFFAVCVLYCSIDFLKAKNIIKYEYDLLFLFVIISGVSLCFCNELLLVYLIIELQSLTLYVFSTFNRNSEFSTEAGLKYFVFGGIMSCFLLIGIGLIYLYFGSVSFELIYSISTFDCDLLFFTGFLFVLIVLLFKVGSVPFHFWLADVYEGSILPVTLLFACAPKIVLFGLFLKICFFLVIDYNSIWSIIIGSSAVLSIILGSISAIFQKRWKRLFAYSTIAHTGFILLVFLFCNLEASKSLIFYVIIYSILSLTTFAYLINSSNSLKLQPKYIVNFSGIGYKNHIFAATFGLTILAVAGIPPLAGFFSKFFVILCVVGSGYYATALVIIVFSSIACFYYIRIIKIMFFVNTVKNNLWVTNKLKQCSENIIGLFLFVILFYFMYPNPIIEFTTAVSLALL